MKRLILTSCFSLGFAYSALAETKLETRVEKKSKAYSITPIVITAEKLEISEGMVSNSSVNEKEIITNPNKNIAEITRTLPNVDRAGSIRGSNAEFKIRGLEDTRITTKIDGSKTNFRAEYKGRNFITPFFLSGISVTRGSNSVMEGSGAIAGSVDMKTKDVEDLALNPNANYGGELFSSYGTNGNMQNYAGAGFVRKNNFSAVLLYSLQENNDFKLPGEENIGNSSKPIITDNIDYTNNKTNNAMVKLKQKFSETEFLQLTSSIYRETGENTSNPFRLSPSFRGEPVDKTLTNVRYSGELNLDVANVKGFYETVKIKESSLTQARVDKTDFSSYGFNAFGNIKYERLENKVENVLIYGAEFIKDTQSGERPGAGRKNIFPDGTSRNEGVYFENAVKWHNFGVLFGARQDYFTLKSGGQTQRYTSDLLKKLVLSYEIANLITPFVRYSEGYRAPLIKETFASGNIVNVKGFNLDLIANPDLKPEYSQNYETGFKFLKENFFEIGSESTLNFTYFIQDIKDFIIQDPKCTFSTCTTGFPIGTSYVFQYQNLDKVRIKGFEVEAKYSSKKYLLSIAASSTEGSEKANGNKLLQTPGNKLVINLGRKFENGISVGVQSLSVASVKSDDDFRKYLVDAMFQPGPNVKPFPNKVAFDAVMAKLAERTSGYSLINLNLDYAYKRENFESLIGVSVDNLFNVKYNEQTSFIPGLGRNINFYIRMKL